MIHSASHGPACSEDLFVLLVIEMYGRTDERTNNTCEHSVCELAEWFNELLYYFLLLF